MTVQQKDESKERQPIRRDPDPELQLNIEAPGRQREPVDEPVEQNDDHDRPDGGNQKSE